jgi:hypothetical protein
MPFGTASPKTAPEAAGEAVSNGPKAIEKSFQHSDFNKSNLAQPS